MRLVDEVSPSVIKIIFGDGKSDATLFREIVNQHIDNFCEVSLFIAELKPNVKGKEESIAYGGLKGVFKLIKKDKTEINSPARIYIAVVDKEHKGIQ